MAAPVPAASATVVLWGRGCDFAAELVFEMVLTAKSTAGKLTMGILLALLLASAGYLIYKTAALAFL